MLRIVALAGLAAFLIPAALGLFATNNLAEREVRVVAQTTEPSPILPPANAAPSAPAATATPTPAPTETPAPAPTQSPAQPPPAPASTAAASADKPVAPDPMPELGQPAPQYTPVPLPEPENVAPLREEPEDRLAEPDPEPVSETTDEPVDLDSAPKAARSESGKSRVQLDDEDTISDQPAKSAAKPAPKPATRKETPKGPRIADEKNGTDVVISAKVLSVRPADGGSMRADVELKTGEKVTALFPPWPGMRVPAVNGGFTADARKISTSDGRATVRILAIRTMTRPAPVASERPPVRVVPGPPVIYY